MQKEVAHERKRANAKLVNAKGTFLPQPPAWPPALCCPPPCSSLHLLLVHLLWGQKLLVTQLFIIRSFGFWGVLPTILEASTTHENLNTSVLVKNLKDPNLAQQRHLHFFKILLHWGRCIIKRCRKTKHLIILRFSTTSQRGHCNLLKTFRASAAAMRKKSTLNPGKL